MRGSQIKTKGLSFTFNAEVGEMVEREQKQVKFDRIRPNKKPHFLSSGLPPIVFSFFS